MAYTYPAPRTPLQPPVIYSTPPWLLELADGTTRVVPTSWADMTMQAYAQVLATDAEVDTYGLLAGVCGCSRMDIQALPPATGNQLLQLLSYLQTAPPALGVWPLPTTVNIPGEPTADGWQEADRRVEIPMQLLAETFGQATDLARVLEEYAEDFGELRRQALAIYLLPHYYACPYDSDKLPQMLLAVDRIRLQEGLPVADFFILSLGQSKQTTGQGSKLYPSVLQSRKQGTTNLVRRGRPTQWQTHWQAVISSKWGLFLLRRWVKY